MKNLLTACALALLAAPALADDRNDCAKGMALAFERGIASYAAASSISYGEAYKTFALDPDAFVDRLIARVGILDMLALASVMESALTDCEAAGFPVADEDLRARTLALIPNR